jgi:hypothetical protein
LRAHCGRCRRPGQRARGDAIETHDAENGAQDEQEKAFLQGIPRTRRYLSAHEDVS